MNDRMGKALGTAVQEYAIRETGKPFNDYHFWIVMKASMSRLGGDGFNRGIIWRALEIVTEEQTGVRDESNDAPAASE